MFMMTNVKILEVISPQNVGETIDYGVKLIQAEREWKETKGAGINVAILDTGIDYNHPDLRDRVKGGYNFTTSDRSDYMDRQGHGTHCAGVVAASQNNIGVVGVAPEVNIYALKVLGDDGAGSLNWMIEAIDWCINNNIHVMSMSLGSNGTHPAVHEAIKRAHDKGIIMVAAAGNDGNGMGDTVDFPARYPEVIAVGAVDTSENLGSFSSTGADVEISAPGVDVLSTYLNGSYARLSGTSMACPHISGAVAILLAKGLNRYGKLLTPSEVKFLLQMHAEDMGSKGKDDKFGFGIFSF